jgi:acetyltransferase-like isoleucine patch superfamily enzyme
MSSIWQGSKMLKALIQVICFFLPWALRRWALKIFCGFLIDPSARVGLSVILADEVEIARGARLGHFNYIGRLDKLEMNEETFIGNFNWVLGLSRRLNSSFYPKKPNRRSELVLGRCSMIGHQNYIDCTDRVELGAFSGIAGARSQLVTHGVEPLASRQTCGPITIGDHTMIGSGSTILKGVKIPNCCIIGAGSVVTHVRPEPYALISGNPAVQVRKMPENAKFFSRTSLVIK